MDQPNLADLLRDLPCEPADEVLACGDARLTLGELRTRVAYLADDLRAAGVQPGQPVANLAGSGPSAVVAMFAVWMARAVYVPLNPRSAPAELAAFLADTPVALVIGDEADLDRFALPTGTVVHNYAAGTVTVRGTAELSVRPHGSDVALVLRTSGTTGRPKAVLLKHSGTIDGLDATLRKLRRGKRADAPRPLQLNMIPVSLALWAGIYNVLFTLRAGNGIVLLERFEPVAFAKAVQDFHIPSVVLPPPMITMLVDAEEVTSLAPLKLVRSITAALSPARAREFHEKFGVFVLNCYGQTELGGEVVGWNNADVREFGAAKLGAAGRPYSDVSLLILRGDRSVADVDEYGEVVVRSPYMMEGYANAELADDRTVDGHLRTGDMGRVDSDGFLWIRGRVSDMINRGGLKVFPDEVEEVLRRHPAVRDAAVAGVPDRRLGEVPHAWIVLEQPVEDSVLDAWCRASLAPYKIPAGFSVLSELPRSEIGKVLRRNLPVPVSTESISFAVAENVTLRGDRWSGEGWRQRPEVLLFPGGGQTRHSWKTAGIELSKLGFRVNSMDTRGHGESDWAPDGDYDLSTLASDMLSVVSQIGRPIVVVGASMGGLTGILATPAAGPSTITALVLVDVVPAYEKGGSARIRDFMQSGLHGFATLDDAAEATANYLPHRPQASSNEGLERNLRKGEDGRWYWHWDPALMRQKPHTDPATRLVELEDAAVRITVPVLLIRGMMSDVVSEEGVERFRKIVPHTQVATLANAAHTAAGDDNEAFAAAVIDFVSSIDWAVRSAHPRRTP